MSSVEPSPGRRTVAGTGTTVGAGGAASRGWSFAVVEAVHADGDKAATKLMVPLRTLALSLPSAPW